MSTMSKLHREANVHKYLSCAFERLYVLDVVNILKALSYENIPMFMTT
jgi:hypothetical protein